MQIQDWGFAPKDVSIILTDLYWYQMSLLLLFLSTGYKVLEIQPPVGLTYIKFKLPASKLWAQIPFLSTFTLFIDIFIPPLPPGRGSWVGAKSNIVHPPFPHVISTCHSACLAKIHGLPQGQTGHLHWIIEIWVLSSFLLLDQMGSKSSDFIFNNLDVICPVSFSTE